MGYIRNTKSYIKSSPYLHILAIFTDPKLTKNNLAGFIVMELGECKKLPDVFSVRLICSNANKGKILMAAALYSIKINKHIRDKRCVLEVAGGFTNPAAYCMYSKFGFKAAPELYGRKGFDDYDNLPMLVDLDKITTDEIIHAALNKVAVDDPLCRVPKQKQPFMGIASQLKMEHDNKMKMNDASKLLLSRLESTGKTPDDLIRRIENEPVSSFISLFSLHDYDSSPDTSPKTPRSHESEFSRSLSPPTVSTRRFSVSKASIKQAKYSRKKKLSLATSAILKTFIHSLK
jgi:hypothetical protein